MSKYKIHIDEALPDSKTIQGYKDFDALYGHYQVNTRFDFWRNLYRNPTNFAVLMMVFAIGALVFEAIREDKAEDYFLKAPATGMGLLPDSLSLENREGWEGPLHADVSLELSQSAFVGPQGEQVVGKYSLVYRWLPKAESWIRRGLPMADENGVYASRGVLEIFAQKGAKPLSLKEDKQILISFELPPETGGFHPMKLDTVSRNWEFLTDTSWSYIWDSSGLQAPGPKPRFELVPADLQAKGANRKPRKPSRPFGVVVSNAADYPAFSPYKKVYWEYLEEPGSANPWEENLLGKENGWNDVRVRRTGEKEYTLTFSKVLPNGNIATKRVKARYLFEAATAEEANQIHQERLKAYAEALEQIKRERAEQVARDSAAYLEALEVWEKRKEQGVVLKGRRCLVRLNELGFVGMLKAVSGREDFSMAAPEASRVWWSSSDGRQLIELTHPLYEGKVPLADSAHIYKLVEGQLKSK